MPRPTGMAELLPVSASSQRCVFSFHCVLAAVHLYTVVGGTTGTVVVLPASVVLVVGAAVVDGTVVVAGSVVVVSGTVVVVGAVVVVLVDVVLVEVVVVLPSRQDVSSTTAVLLVCWKLSDHVPCTVRVIVPVRAPGTVVVADVVPGATATGVV